MVLASVTRWAVDELPRLNRAILAGQRGPATLIRELNQVIAELPDPAAMTPGQAQRLVVDLGLAGVSVARHYQEEDPTRKTDPEAGFDPLVVGPARTGFLAYFRAVADRTGTGHPPRDSYASLVRWNLPPTTVRWADETLATLPGVFDGASVHTYTGHPSEARFFQLLKSSEAVERAVNLMLEPLSDGTLDLLEAPGRERVRRATALLTVLRRLSVNFAALPPAEGLQPTHFLDVFRQFAVHWRVGDVPPSGALDPEALKRDLLLGIAMPDYPRHIHRVYNSLLSQERVELDQLLDRERLPLILLRRLGLPVGGWASYGADGLRDLLTRTPALAEWYELLEANARVGGAHLRLSRKFLFQPQRSRDAAGVGDRVLVSNRRGTTGMDEHILQQLTQARRDHDLAAFRSIAHGPGSPITGDPEAEAQDLSAITVVTAGEAVGSPNLGSGWGRPDDPPDGHRQSRSASQAAQR
jgi:hypothetical protein